MPYDVLDVASFIINYSNEKENVIYEITNLRLQKMLYFVQAYFLINRGRKCFKEGFEAWMYGPVVKKAYRAFKAYGGGALPHIISNTIYNDAGEPIEKNFHPDVISQEHQNDIRDAVSLVDRTPTGVLGDIIRGQRPWSDAYRAGQLNKISDYTMEDFFCEQRPRRSNTRRSAGRHFVKKGSAAQKPKQSIAGKRIASS